MSLAASLWFWKKIQDFRIVFQNFEFFENFENYELIYPSQRQNLLPTLEIMTHQFFFSILSPSLPILGHN